ncbi:hypothetical protein FisN_3Hh012 [Fistulifera solaris]|uniref:Choline transporter-like protein n=1 Tax=Fistulifera solaris TaxID=1519565 RepID=A0A1Z5K0E9_FISSO|nr:hypothetical protein FisN_3Hh012 [Fistulifera solaris]|eukprot:GAX19783.1 hypothetical protein FisN_3Hh012 [Fistulifera solaris]
MDEKLLNNHLEGDEYFLQEQHGNLLSPSPLLTVRTDVSYPNTQEKPARAYRNQGAALLFLMHMAVVFYCALQGGWPVAVEQRLLGLLFLTGCTAVALSTIAWYAMTQYSQHFVVVALSSTFAGHFFAAGVLIYFRWWSGVLLAIAFAAVTLIYLRTVWDRTHVAAAQLQVALQAIERNKAVLSLTYFILLSLQLWVLIWLMAWLGFYNLTYGENCSDNNDNDDQGYYCIVRLGGHGGVLFFFWLSFFWTTQVLRNVLRVTVAGVVGSFVCRPEYPAVGEAFRHATTSSFGSICFGSLLTALIQALYQICRMLQRTSSSSSGNFLVCIVDCIVGFLERLTVYFHKWSYIYIGLYGDDYLTAGQNVLQLFRERGWDTIITDQLVVRTLQLFATMVGVSTGAVALLMGPSLHWSKLVTFAIPALLGGTLSYILFLSVVGAAVDSIIVLFAEAPLELERNHPGLYRQMVTAWSQLYPDEFRAP